MKIVFISNMFNHHQKYLSDALYSYTDGNYTFIATTDMDESFKKIGYTQYNNIGYVIKAFDDKEKAYKTVAEADVCITGSVALWFKIHTAAKVNYRYSERVLKTNSVKTVLITMFQAFFRNRPKRNSYLLSASAFAPYDFAKFGMYKRKAYKWGYFPQTLIYDIDELLSKKEKNLILWCGRLINWKHPDDAVKIANILRNNHYIFHMKIVGTGYMFNELSKMIKELELDEYVDLVGPLKQEEVRKLMEKASIYLFTSDKQEGWGAVLNEAMNSGCAVVASHAIGSVPYLINNGANGLVYKSGDLNDLYSKVTFLLKSDSKRCDLSREAYRTIAEKWNADIAGKRLVTLTKAIIDGNDLPDLYEDGPCSLANIIRDDWFRRDIIVEE